MALSASGVFLSGYVPTVSDPLLARAGGSFLATPFAAITLSTAEEGRK